MKNQAAVALGSIKTDKKAKSSRENGKLGGRPNTITTYTVVQWEQNSWTVDADGNHNRIEKWDCGHRHLTLTAATKCLNKLSGTTRSIGAGVRDNLTGMEVERDWSV